MLFRLVGHALWLYSKGRVPLQAKPDMLSATGLCKPNSIKHLKLNTTTTKCPSCPPKHVACLAASSSLHEACILLGAQAPNPGVIFDASLPPR